MIHKINETLYIEEKGDECFVVYNGNIVERCWGETSLSDAKRFALDLMFEEQRQPNYNSHLGWL